MKNLARSMIAAAFVFSFSQLGFAQMTPPGAPTVPKTPAAPKVPYVDDMAKKAKANECSAKADAQGLQGKARKEFQAKCIKG